MSKQRQFMTAMPTLTMSHRRIAFGFSASAMQINHKMVCLIATLFCTFPVLADLKLPIRVSENRVLDNDEAGLNKTLEYNFSPEDRARLRKALTDYARNTDPDHQLMLQKRKAMHESITQRFNECNRDNDDSLDREEATLCLPQVARHFSYVDVDGNGVITLEELELAQLKMSERQRAVEVGADGQQANNNELDVEGKLRNKLKLNPLNNTTGKEVSVSRKRPG